MPTENQKKYKQALVAFLSRKHGVTYSSEHEFDASVFNAILDTDVADWLRYKAFGSETINDDDVPLLCRSSTLYFHKKAISFFIPNKHIKWCVISQVGNPTTSPEVNAIIKRVKKHEVRKEGVPSQARRALLTHEFRLLLRIAERNASFALHLRLPTMAKFQVHLIARIDDTVNVNFSDLRVHPQYEFALSVRLRWTKNCMEERDAPDQIILGAMDSDFCVIAALSVYLQYVFEFTTASASSFLFCDETEDPDTVKRQVSNLLYRQVLLSEEWTQQVVDLAPDDSKCGTHSIRKLAATTTRLAGRTPDEVDCRGRWRDTKRVSDRYTSISLPLIDATVAASLCIGGPAKYEAIEGSGVNNRWLTMDFVPHIASKMGNAMGIVLGKALLWCLMEPQVSSTIPKELRTRLRERYQVIQLLGDDVNPVERIPLTVYPANGLLQIDPIFFDDGENADGVGVRVPRAVASTESAEAIIAQNHALRGRLEELHNTVRLNHDALRQDILTVRRVVHRFANRPTHINNGFVRRVENAAVGGAAVGAAISGAAVVGGNENNKDQPVKYESTLSGNPKDLFALWEEYIYGLAGRKAAKDFSLRERGRVRYKYHQRKVVWDRILELIRHGETYITAIEEIYRVYGRDTTVTNIINRLRLQRRVVQN